MLETALIVLAASVPPPKPRILGVSHVAYRVSDLGRSRSFYRDFLGFSIRTASAGTPRGEETAIVPLNERQYVELRSGLETGQDRLDHLALETDDVEAMRRFLASRGIAVPERLTADAAGNPAFSVTDPEGHTLEFVRHAEDTWPRREARDSLPSRPISRRMMHTGIVVTGLEAATRFYYEVLGHSETWRGSRSGTELSWINAKVPDGDDYLELMLYATPPAPDARGSQHHICLEVPDVEASRAWLVDRPYRAGYTQPLEARVGTNRKRQLNLYDPDGTRIELMEPGTIDGEPAPPSTAPPPRATSP